MNDVAEVLRRAFPELKGEGFDHLVAVAHQRTYPPDTVVVREEEAGQKFFVILKGEVEVSKRMEGQSQRVLHHHGPGEFFGEMALIETAPRTATVRTRTHSTLLEINKDDFDMVLTQRPAMALVVMRKLTQRLRQADQTAIAELRQKNEELARANRELKEAEELRSDFLTIVAHELRTPLTSASGYLALISEGKMPADQMQQAVNRAMRNVKRVVKLVNDIMFLQEMDLIMPEFRPVSMREIMSQVAASHRQQALEADLSLRVQVEESLPEVMGDPEWLHRAVDALVDNAIKFSPNAGEIAISASFRDGRLQLAVSDQGLGIPDDQIDRVFDRFRRIHEEGPYIFDGVGLGLPLVKQVVEQHGGAIEVQSVEGQGSTFTLSLPVAS